MMNVNNKMMNDKMMNVKKMGDKMMNDKIVNTCISHVKIVKGKMAFFELIKRNWNVICFASVTLLFLAQLLLLC